MIVHTNEAKQVSRWPGHPPAVVVLISKGLCPAFAAPAPLSAEGTAHPCTSCFLGAMGSITQSAELCSPGGESPIVSYEFSSLFLGNQSQRLILARICTQQHPVKSTCGRCSFWQSWRSDSDSCQCPVLQSDISTGRTSQRKGFVVKSDSVPSSGSYSILSGLELGAFRSCWGVWAW